MSNNFVDQVPTKRQVILARLLALLAVLILGAFVASFWHALFNGKLDSSAYTSAAVFSGLFLSSLYILLRSFFSRPRRPSRLALVMFSILNFIVGAAGFLATVYGRLA